MGVSVMGMASNYAAAKAFQAQCSDRNPTPCVLAKLSYAQAATDALGLLQAFATKSKADNSFNGEALSIPPLSSFRSLSDLGNYLEENKSLLEKAKSSLPDGVRYAFQGDEINGLPKEIGQMKTDGYDVDLSTGAVTQPDGSSLSNNEIAAASQGTMKKLSPQMKDIKRRVALAQQAMDKHIASGGGSLGGFKDSHTNTSSKSLGSNYKNLFANWNLQKKRNPTSNSIKGLKKMLGSHPIGVAGDDIFDMISRRYSVMNNENQFAKE